MIKEVETEEGNTIQITRDNIPETETDFYVTYDGTNHQIIRPWMEEHDVPVMKNASNYWRPKEETWRDPPEWDTPLIVDCGGYNVQVKHGEYPWSVESYNDWLNRNSGKVEWAPPMDYACEERFDDKWSYRKRMEKTLDNTIEQFDLEQDGWDLTPVLQGRSIHDYVEFYEWLRDHGIPTDSVGLGTVCRISNTHEIVSVERKLRKRTKIDNIHGFGVKIEAFKFGATFDSADSAAWVYPVSFGDYYEYSGNPAQGLNREEGDDPQENRLKTFQNYYKYVKDILSKQERKRRMQTTAMDW